MAIGPSFRSEIFDLPVGRPEQAGEHVTQVGVRIDAASTAVFDEGVDDGAIHLGRAISRFRHLTRLHPQIPLYRSAIERGAAGDFLDRLEPAVQQRAIARE